MTTTVTRWNAREADEHTVFIGRPSKWGNPFRIGRDGNRAEVIDKYILWFIRPEQAELRIACRRDLRGKKLACFCSPLPCHGHVLAYYADAEHAPYLNSTPDTNLFTRARWKAGA